MRLELREDADNGWSDTCSEAIVNAFLRSITDADAVTRLRDDTLARGTVLLGLSTLRLEAGTRSRGVATAAAGMVVEGTEGLFGTRRGEVPTCPKVGTTVLAVEATVG